MKEYLRFFRGNKSVLLFGMLMIFFSSFGQTFLLSLYIPNLLAEFSLSGAHYSAVYAGATLMSASVLIILGRRIDLVPLKQFSLFVISGIILAQFLAAFTVGSLWLFFSIFMLRLFGQGLLSHTAMTTMGRYFEKDRGKAVSIAYLGFPAGEALLPVLILLQISGLGWRGSFFVSAMAALLLLLPLALWLIRQFQNQVLSEKIKRTGFQTKENELNEVEKDVGKGLRFQKSEPLLRRRELLKTKAFWLYAPTVFLVGFMLTSLFFFQTFIAQEKQWSLEWMAAGITAYAISSSVFSLLSGPMIDRFSARKLFPLILLPLVLGLFVLTVFDHGAFTPLYWLLIGITGGISSPITSALYAETFGTRSLGTVRSLFTFVMVISTAFGPLVYSWLLELGWSFACIHLLIAAFIMFHLLYVHLMGKTGRNADI